MFRLLLSSENISPKKRDVDYDFPLETIREAFFLGKKSGVNQPRGSVQE